MDNVTPAYAEHIICTVIPDRVNTIEWAVRQDLITADLGKREIAHERAWATRFEPCGRSQ
jgi:hypothetical protein